MTEYWIAFITGLTTGGLSCLAVQGGLLASSFSNQIEQSVQTTGSIKTKKNSHYHSKPRVAHPIILFLSAKLVAYTVLGFLLGMAGSIVQLSPVGRGILQILIGLYLAGNGLRLFNIHPIFRYFAFSPPKTITRFIRQKSKGGISPIFLGILTVLIPCGITQAMMAAALGTSEPVKGALLMFSFTLGTSPIFFALFYLAIRLGTALERKFNLFIAAVLLILGLTSIETGLNLMGSPVSISRLFQRETASFTSQPEQLKLAYPGPQQINATAPPSTAHNDDPKNNIYTINVLNNGYIPEVLHVKSGKQLTLNLVSNDILSCTRAFTIPSLNIEEILPATGKVSLTIPPQPKGTSIPYSCSMGMFAGLIYFD